RIVEPSCARTFEELRFAAYTLEKGKLGRGFSLGGENISAEKGSRSSSGAAPAV
ncbi:unnamed protein product, partial [marine sediment metagenome]